MPSKDFHRHILVVAGGSESRSSYAQMLTADPQFRYTTVESDSGTEALELCLIERPDCVLLDFALTDLSGLEFLTVLSREYRNAFIPIVALIDLQDEGLMEAAMRLGAQDYLVKGELTQSALQLTVNRVIEKVSLRRQLAAKRLEFEQFAGTVARDLEGPLRRVVGYTQILRHEAKERLSPRGQECLELISSHARTMGALVEDLLSYATTLHTRGAPPEPVDLEAMTRHVVSCLEDQIRESGAVIEIGEMVTVTADRTSIREVLKNLITNAVMYRGVDEPRIEIQSLLDQDYMTLTVKDNGVGIDIEDQERIFLPLTRLHRRDRAPGNGLGLAKCRKIVEKYGGQIRVRSALGEGAIFTVVLPQSTIQTTVPLA